MKGYQKLVFSKVVRREIIRNRHRLLMKQYGEEAPATQAALGRLYAYTGNIPLTDIASVACTRVEVPGYHNRTQRKKLYAFN